MGFLITIVVVVVAVHVYLWLRLVRPATRPGSLPRRVFTWALVVLGVLLPLAVAGGRVFGMTFEHVIAWPGYMWLAVMFYLLVFTVALEIPRAVAVLATRRAGRQPAGIDRRVFIARTAATVAGVGALATVGYGVRTALGDPVIERIPVRLPRLDPRMSGLRLAVVSDIHIGPLTGKGHAERIVRMINGLQADVVTIVGDLVDGTVAELGPLAAPLRHLESRYGAYFVTGNHEYYTSNGPQEWIEELNSLGVRSLRNERVEIAHAGAVLDLAGINDLNGTLSEDGPDFEKALGGRDTARPVVLLAHQPVQIRQAAGHGVDLQLSGHTHGGQMAPFNLAVPLQQPVVAGLDKVDGTQIYVTRGAGYWGPPVRVGAPPEITLIELRA